MGRREWDGWEARGGLYLQIGLFGVSMSPKSASHGMQTSLGGLRDVSLTQG